MSFMQSFPRPVKTYHTQTYDRISKNHGFDGKTKTVLITGGASGLGYHFLKHFARAGTSRIAIVNRNAEQQKTVKAEIESNYPECSVLCFAASITDKPEMDAILQSLGTIDILILNAAIAHRRAEATEISAEEMQEALNINVTATFNLTQTFLGLPTPPSGAKTILNVSSAAAYIPISTRAAYGASKAAAASVMQAFSAQYANNPAVWIYSFHPGSFYTPGVAANMPRGMMEWEDEALVADFALWLCSDEARFLHGRFVWAEWDVDELVELRSRLEREKAFLTLSLVL